MPFLAGFHSLAKAYSFSTKTTSAFIGVAASSIPTRPAAKSCGTATRESSCLLVVAHAIGPPPAAPAKPMPSPIAVAGKQ